uniref:OBG-type G domain-containing protein n=1 Tax=Cercocebus atys TaxID=9531 RepID=A0A2K5LSY3_CERAT
MGSTLAKIVEIEAEMTQTQKNKATAHHLGLLKARLAKLRPGEGSDVAKTGDAQTGFVGFSSVAKSTLLSNLAGVYSEVAAYEFTTLTTVPGVIRHKGAKIQLLDLPGIIKGAKDGKGKGQVIAVAQTCNLILIVLDVLKPLGYKKINGNELEGFGIRLNSKPPNIGFKKKDKGGINLTVTCPQSELDAETVKSILVKYKIHNADVTLRRDATADDLIDVLEGNRVYIPCIYVENLHQTQRPITRLPIPTGASLLQDHSGGFLHEESQKSYKEFKYALVWGLSVKHNPQKVGKDHTLEDEDVIQIVKK